MRNDRSRCAGTLLARDMTIAIARPLRVPRKMGTDWPVMAILRQLKTGYLATARLFGAEGFHWIYRRGAMRGNITGEERRESKHYGYCYKSWEIPRAHSEQQSS